MKKKIFAITLIVALLICTMSVIVSASSLVVSAKAGKTEVKPGEEVTVTLSLTNIDKGDKDGVNGITGTISYNSDVLTYVSNTTLNGWSVNAFDNSTFAITNGNQYITSNQEIITFTFKVKDNVTVTSTEVEITGIETSFGTSLDITNAQTVAAADATATITITPNQVAQSSDNTPAPTTGNSTPQITSDVLNSNLKKDKSLPQTGISDVILPAVVILAVISIISYIRYKNYKNI